MIGNPKHLNSKFDYEYVKNNCDESYWKPLWQNLLDMRYKWFTTKKLDKKEDGVEDDTHRIETIAVVDPTTQKETGENEYYQLEYLEDPASDFVELGFTEDEVKKALA